MIRCEHLTYSVGEFRLEDANLDVGDGEYFVLLGPPGSGKSMLLECLCGLNRIERGQVWLDGFEITDWEPRRRGIGYVPQDYALFPHLSVRRNIASGLVAHGESRSTILERVNTMAEMLGIEHLLDRSILGLSGGERQRVALGRALAIQPRVLLLDEPVSALDESTREHVCAELRQLQRQLNITTIHVSHNLEEAFSLGDRGGILHNGRFQQIGPLDQLLRRPASEFAARFMRCKNILVGQSVGCGPNNTTRVRVGNVDMLAPGTHSGPLRLVLRPENIRLVPADAAPTDCSVTTMPVELVRAVDLGAYTRVDLNGAVPLVAHVPRSDVVSLRSGSVTALVAVIPPEAIHILPVNP